MSYSSHYLTTLNWEDTGELDTDDLVRGMVKEVEKIKPPFELIKSTDVVIKMRYYGKEIRELKSWQESGTLPLEDYKQAVAEITEDIVDLLTKVAYKTLKVTPDV